MSGRDTGAQSPLRWVPLARRRARRDGTLRPFAIPAEPTPFKAAVELPLLLLVAAVVALILKAFVAQAFYIPSASMEPQLQVGDRVVVSRTAYRLHEPRRGDIVVFPSVNQEVAPDRGLPPARAARELLEGLGLRKPPETELIKRVVGLPGETIEGRGGHVFVDSRELVEPYLPPGLATADFGPVTVPDDHVFVLGDNRAASGDSRVFGPVRTDTIVGRAVSLVWPPGRAGHL